MMHMSRQRSNGSARLTVTQAADGLAQATRQGALRPAGAAEGNAPLEIFPLTKKACDTGNVFMHQPSSKSRLLRLALGAWLSGTLLLSCGQLLGKIEVETERLEPTGSGGAGSSSNGTPCEPGSTRCNEGMLQMCVRFDPALPTGWIDQYNCGTSALCSAGPPAVCVRPTCQAGEGSCSDAIPRVCNAAQTGWDELAACTSAAHCSTQAAQCPDGAPCCLIEPCAPGELRCNEGRLEECQADLTGWLPRSTCETPELCLSGLAECNGTTASCSCEASVCAEGETRCTGSALERCNAGRTGWDLVSECGTSALCDLGLALEPVRCQAPACAPGQFTCEGAQLRSCRPDLAGFDDGDVCVGPAFCNAAAGQCDPAPCEPGERSCNGAQIQVCAGDQSGFIPEGPPCATAELCNDSVPGNARCDTPNCGVDEFNCFGSNQLQVCNDGRTGFELAGPPCLRPDLCSAERRRCDFCVPGRQECTPDLLSSRVCALSGNFFGPETFCPLGCVSTSGQCQTCNVGEYRCTNGNLSRCNDGRSFTPLNRSTDCSNGQQVVCSNGSVSQSGCAPGLFCGGTGQCICTPGPAFCDDDDLVICDGRNIVPADQCQGEDGDILTTCDNGDISTDRCNSAQQCNRSDGDECGNDGPGNGGPGNGGPGRN
jgi:hypothetical protein